MVRNESYIYAHGEIKTYEGGNLSPFISEIEGGDFHQILAMNKRRICVTYIHTPQQLAFELTLNNTHGEDAKLLTCSPPPLFNSWQISLARVYLSRDFIST